MLSTHLRVLYLHGFASTPASRKAQFFKEKLNSHGVGLEVPALDQGDFENLTISRQLELLNRVVAGQPVALIGSSLGGYLAALFAARNSGVTRLLLLAPAFQFHHLWASGMGPKLLEEWRRTGSMPIFHYGEQRPVKIGYALIEDAANYEAWPDFRQRALIFHGTEDRSVPVQYSEEFTRNHPNTRLIRKHSGHELTDVLDEIWEQSDAFLLGRSLLNG
jgi:pimeloyl-ACP methyl ester carboxylesterase